MTDLVVEDVKTLDVEASTEAPVPVEQSNVDMEGSNEATVLVEQSAAKTMNVQESNEAPIPVEHSTVYDSMETEQMVGNVAQMITASTLQIETDPTTEKVNTGLKRKTRTKVVARKSTVRENQKEKAIERKAEEKKVYTRSRAERKDSKDKSSPFVDRIIQINSKLTRDEREIVCWMF